MELFLLALLALLVFGPRRLPEVARTVGKLMAELRRASNEFRYSLEDEIRQIEVKEQTEKRAALAAAAPPPVAGTVTRAATLPEASATPPPGANQPV